jgi:hypothetical protein
MILRDIEKLYLSESYSFTTIYDQGDTSFAAKLELTPAGIKFSIMADEHDGRKLEFPGSQPEQLVCRDRSQIFIMRNLQLLTMRERSINDNHSLWFFECTYSVGHLFHCCRVNFEPSFIAVKLHSKSVGTWVGMTTSQDNILEKYENDSPDIFEDPYELIVSLSASEAVGVLYNISLGGDGQFRNGISFRPSFDYILGEVSAKDALEGYYKLYNFLAFVLGYFPIVERVEVIANGCSEASLYFPTQKPRTVRYDELGMLPLGHNIKSHFAHTGLPPIPPEVFVNYFKAGSNVPDLIAKYTTYNNMTNIEDSFLGFFRLLEKQCFKPKSYLEDSVLSGLLESNRDFLKGAGFTKRQIASFASAVKRVNGGKYNTEKCITDFYMSLPSEIKDALKVDTGDIGGACNLRNDITHANPYSISENDMLKNTTLIRKLLVYSLLSTLGLDLELFSLISKRMF